MLGGNPSPRSIHTFLTPVAIAVIIGGLILSDEVRALVQGILVFAVALAGLIWAGRTVANLASGHRCPACGQARLARRDVQTFGDRFFECMGCGARMVRSVYGSWRDASGPEYADRFVGGIALDPWTRTRSAGPEPQPEAEVAPDPSTTHAALLRLKRQRTPESPNGPGLIP